MPSPVRIYAGTQEGLFVWRSKNGSWEKVAVSFESGTIDSIDGLRSQPNVVYLGVTQDGLYRTDDQRPGYPSPGTCRDPAVLAVRPWSLVGRI